jgi:hypothetical protein
MEEFLKKEIFEQMCSDLRHCFGDLEYLYNEPIENTKEVCKYIIKCDELMDVKDDDLVAYYHATLGLRTVQSMGGFAAFKKALKATGRTIRTRFNSQTNQTEFVPMKNWNHSFAGDIQERTAGERLEKNIRDMIDGPAGALTKPALIARMAPSYLNSPVAEPLFMVRGRCYDMAEFKARQKIAKVIEQTRTDFFAGWQDFRSEYGVSFEMWLKQGEIAAIVAAKQPDTAGTPQDFKGFFDSPEPAPKVSAHNTSTTGRDSPPASKSAKPDRGKNERSEVPIGRAKPVSSIQSSEKITVEPSGAVNRSQESAIDGSLCSKSIDWDNYF